MKKYLIDTDISIFFLKDKFGSSVNFVEEENYLIFFLHKPF
ncbi:MAG: hypothetical protein AAF806_19250 [Bacteroidota bacterium]